MSIEELCICAVPIPWNFFTFKFALDNSRLVNCGRLSFYYAGCVHVEVAAFQTMYTFLELLLWHYLTLPLEIQKVTKKLLKLLYQLLFFKKISQFIDSHHRNSEDLEFSVWVISSSILIIFGIAHPKEAQEELVDLVGNECMSEHKNLVVCPDIIKC